MSRQGYLACGDKVTVTWSAPAAGGTVSEYLVSCSSTAGTVTATVGGQILTGTVGPLATSGAQYTCSVTAKNAIGDSSAVSAPFTTG